MIVTCKKRIPFHWLLVTILPWSSWVFVACMMSVAFLFSLKKFVENPAGLTFVISLPGIISIVVGPSVSFISDRIWTRFGRRKPFVITAWTLCSLCTILMPLMPNFWLLLAAYILFNIGCDLQTTQEPLKQEIIPPAQRGRMTAGITWMTQLGVLLFYSLAIGRFDDRLFYLGVPITGEQSIYWAASAGMVLMTLLICLSIKEVDPKSRILGEKFNLRNFFKGILHHNLWPVYLLVIGSVTLDVGAGLGVISNLLYTDQWNFTKQEMGNNVAIGTSINLVLIAILGYFADKLNRIRTYQVLIVASLLVNAFFYIYINFILYDRRPILLELVLFGEVLSAMGILITMMYTPLVYDYVPRNEMGTFMAGSNLLQRVTGLLTLNGVGIFVWLYATLFLPPGGDMARVVFRENLDRKQVAGLLAKASWTDPESGQPRPAKDITAAPWYANGAVLPFGRCYEIRLSDPDSVARKKERDTLEEQRGNLTGKEETLRDRARLLQAKAGDAPGAAKLLAEADRLKTEAAPLATQISKLDATLQRRGDIFEQEAEKNLNAWLLQPGEQIQHAAFFPATVFEFATPNRAATPKLERTLEALRRNQPEVIDLRPVKTATGYGVAVSVTGNPSLEKIQNLSRALALAAARPLPGEFSATQNPIAQRPANCLEMDLVTVEEPLVNHLSPIARAVNAVVELFAIPAGPERRISAIGRSLREPGLTEQVSVRSLNRGNEVDHAIRVNAIFENQSAVTNAPSAITDVIGQRLAGLLGDNGEPMQLARARVFYDRVVTASSEQRLTIASPTFKAGFAPMKYDYMSAYLWLLLVGLFGLGITIMFLRWERRGLVRKRGKEEVEAA